MPRYVAFLRGVSPANLTMPALKRCIESAGFANVKTVRSSGNAAFDSRSKNGDLLEREIERAMQEDLGKAFLTIVRASPALRAMLETDPYAPHAVPTDAKRIVTFVREPSKEQLKLPIVGDGVHVVATTGHEVFSAYLPHPRGPLFMAKIEKLLGVGVTTRTWETVRRCASA